MKKILLSAILFFLILISAAMAIHINEVMYNPAGSDNNREFVEIYLENNQSLENWTIADSESNDTLNLLYFSYSNYALIVEDGYEYTNSGASYYTIGATIGNNLNNDLDEVMLYDTHGNIIDSMNYDGSMANSNNRSLELYNGSWYESIANGGTPGYENSILAVFNNTANLSNLSNSTDISENITINSTETNSSTNNTNINTTNQAHSDGCDIKINISADSQVYGPDEKIKYRISLNDTSHDFIIEYWIEDLFSSIVKSRYNTTNTNLRTWTPAGKEMVNAYFIKARLAYADCSMASAANASLLVVVKGKDGGEDEKDEDKREEPELRIENVYLGTDNSAKSGETISLRLYAYRGSTAKSVVEVYAQDEDKKRVSEVSRITLHSKYSENSITIPLKLKCNNIDDDTTYTIVARGLGLEDSESIMVKGSIKECQGCSIPSIKCDKSPEIKSHKPYRIRSFYTLARKYAPRINLFASIDAADEEDNNESELLLVSSREKLVKDVNSSSRIRFDASVKDGRNIFYLALLQNGTFADMKELVVEFNDSSAAKIYAGKDNDTGQDSTAKAPNAITSYAAVEPGTIYESVGERSKGRIKYLFAALGCILAAIFVWRRHG